MNGKNLETASVDIWKLNARDDRNSKENLLLRFPSGNSFWLGRRYLVWSTDNSRFEYSDGSQAPVWTALNVSAGSTLDSAHTAGGTITATNATGVVGITDQQTTAVAALAVTNTGVVPGSTSKSVVSIESSATHTTTGNVRLLELNFSGTAASGAPQGLVITMPNASDNAIAIVRGSLYMQDGDLSLDDVTLSGDLTISNSDTSSGITVTKSSVTDGKVINLTANGLTSGDMIYGASSSGGATTMKFARFYDGAADVFDVGIDGTTHIKGTASGTTALLVDAGDAVLTAGHLTLTLGNIVQTAGNYTNTLGNGTFTSGNLTLSAGVLTVTPAATSTKGFVLSGASTRSVALEEITASGVFSQPQVIWTASGAGTGNFFSGVVSAAMSGHFWKAAVGAVAFTGDVLNVDLGATSTTGQALVLAGGAAARTTSLVQLTDASTGAAADTIAAASANTSASGAMVRLTESASFAGCGLQVVTDAADAGAFGVKLSTGTRAFSSALVDVSIGAANTAAPTFLVTQTATGAATTASHGFSFVSSGTGFLGSAVKATLGASTGAQVLVGTTTGGNRTTDLVSLTDAGVGAGHACSVTASGINSGHLYYGTFSAAGTGNGLHVAMGSNVAGGGLVISSAATTGVGISVSHTGAFASAAAVRNVVSFSSTGAWDADTTNPSYVLNVEQSTGAGAVGDYAFHLSATGTNVEALHVDAGTSKFDESVTVGVSNTGVGTNAIGLQINASPGAQGLAIDATTAGDRPTHTDGVVDVNVTTATASTRSLSVDTTTTGDQDAVVGIESVFSSGGLTTATKRNSAFKASYLGDPTDLGYYASFWSASAATFGVTSAFMATGSHDRTLSTLDTMLKVQPVTTSSGVGKELQLYGGAAHTSGVGGAVSVIGGAGANASNGGAVSLIGGSGAGAGTGGAIVVHSGAGAANGTITFGIGGTTDKMVLDEAAAAAGFSGVNTVAMSATMRPTRVRPIPVLTMHPVTGAAAATYEGGPARTFVDATANQAAFYFPITSDVDGTADITVEIIWTAAAGAGGIAAFRLNYKAVADNGDMQTGFTNTSVTNDTLTGNDDQERVEIAIPHAGFADGDLLLIRVERLPADASDTLGQDLSLLHVNLRYRSLTP